MSCLLRWHFQHVLISERLNRSITHKTMAAESFGGARCMHHRAASVPKTVSLGSRESRFIFASRVCFEVDCGIIYCMSFVSAACHTWSCVTVAYIPIFFYPTVSCYGKMWTFATPKHVRGGDSLKKTHIIGARGLYKGFEGSQSDVHQSPRKAGRCQRISNSIDCLQIWFLLKVIR